MKLKGFTLIELLVVIAIIGILSSVVLASLNSARNKATNTSVKTNLANARAEAEIFYGNAASPTYDGVCALTGTNVIGDSIAAAASSTGATYTVSDTANGGTAAATCHDSSAGWAAIAPLRVAEGTFTAWCVDSAGASKGVLVTALDTDNDVTCD